MFAFTSCLLVFVLSFDLSLIREAAQQLQQALLAVTVIHSLVNLCSTIFNGMRALYQAFADTNFGAWATQPLSGWHKGIDSGMLNGAALGEVVLLSSPDEQMGPMFAVDVAEVLVDGVAMGSVPQGPVSSSRRPQGAGDR